MAIAIILIWDNGILMSYNIPETRFDGFFKTSYRNYNLQFLKNQEELIYFYKYKYSIVKNT